MENQLQVIVKQEPGTVTWNFVQLKDSLADMMKTYESMVYTEDSLAAAKQDLASLRKLKGAVEDKRKEIRKKCLEPYAVIESQAKELTSLIDKPITAIDGQVKAYEEDRRKEKKDTIIKYMDEAFADLPGDIAKKLQCKVYDTRWENATMAKKVWVDAINAAHEQTATELKILAEVDEDFKDMAMQAYKVGLSLADAQGKINELQRQREIIRQREQERREAEERRRAEQAQARKEREAAATLRAALETLAPAQEKPVMEKDQQAAEAYRRLRQAAAPAPTSEPAQTALPQSGATQTASKADVPEGITEKVIRIWGNEKQITKIFGYIKFTGAIFQEVEA